MSFDLILIEGVIGACLRLRPLQRTVARWFGVAGAGIIDGFRYGPDLRCHGPRVWPGLPGRKSALAACWQTRSAARGHGEILA